MHGNVYNSEESVDRGNCKVNQMHQLLAICKHIWWFDKLWLCLIMAHELRIDQIGLVKPLYE